MTPKKRSIVIVGAVVAVAALVLGAAFSGVWLASGASGKQTESLGIQGAVTLTLYGPAGQTLGVWKTHNSLVQPGISFIAECLSNSGQSADTACPGGSLGYQSLTADRGVAIGSCGSVSAGCGVAAASTNAVWPHGCDTELTCLGWVASASFGSTVLASALGTCTSDCPLNDVQSGTSVQGGNALLNPFDNIPSTNFPSPISISAGDALSVNINFTVS